MKPANSRTLKTALLPMGDRKAEDAVTWSAWLDTFDLVKKGFARHGQTFPDTCRLAEYERAINAAINGSPNPTYPSKDLFTHALLEMRQLRLIATHLCPLSLKGLDERLKKIRGGQASPSDERADTQARDAQFELLLAAFFVASGCGVSFEEPDIIVQFDGLSLAVAAKRLKSERGVSKNVRKARQQTVKAQRLGIIAVDISCLGGVAESVESALVHDPHHATRDISHKFAHRILRDNALEGLVDASQIPALLICTIRRFSDADGLPFGTAINWDFLYLPHAKPQHVLLIEALHHRLRIV